MIEVVKRLLGLLSAVFVLASPAIAQTHFGFNNNDPIWGSNHAICLIIADGTGGSTSLLQDYTPGNPQPTIAPHVTGSSTFGNPVQVDPTISASWPWQLATCIRQHIYAINCDDGSGHPLQPYADWENLISASYPLGNEAVNGPGTNSITYFFVLSMPNNFSALARVFDSNKAAPMTLYPPEIASSNTMATTWRNTSNSGVANSWTGIANTYMIIVITINNSTGIATVYGNFSLGAQTSVANGLNVLVTSSSISSNFSWGGAFTTLVVNGSGNSSNTLSNLFDGVFVEGGALNYCLTALQVNQLALDPVSCLYPYQSKPSVLN